MNRKTVLQLLIMLSIFLPALTAASQNQYLIYVYTENSVSNLYLCDLTSLETRLLTCFSDKGTITSISASEAGWPIYFTRASADNGRSNPTIWTVNLDGSGLTDVASVATSSDISYTYVAVSPDGQKVAYVANSIAANNEYHLFVCSPSGTNRRQLTFAPGEICSYPVFIDNETILFKSQVGYLQNYYTVTTSGTGLTNLTNNQSHSPYFPRLGRPMLNSSRSRAIFAQQIQETWGYRKWSIYTLNLLTGSQIEETPDVFPWWGLYYDFQPDPLKQPEPYPVFVSDSQVGLVGTQDSTASETDVNLYITSLPIGNPYQWQLTFTGGISLPYFVIPAELPTQIIYQLSGRLYRVDEANQVTQLTWFSAASDPTLDSRGCRIAYVDNGLWMMKINGSDLICLEQDVSVRYPAFSPDSSWIVYVKNNDIYARLTDLTNSPVRLTVSPDMPKSDLSFSPDGRQILFTGASNGKKQLYLLPVTITESPSLILPNGSPVNLTPGSNDNYQGRFSPDGNMIAFISTRAQIPEIWMMNRDGSAQRKILFSDNKPVNPSWVQFSSYEKNRLLYLSGTPEKICTADISILPCQGILRTPEIVASQFVTGPVPPGIVRAYRHITLDTLDPHLYLVYRLKLYVDAVPAPSSVVLTENLPAGWKLKDVKINGVTPAPLTSNNQTEGTLKWVFGPTGVAPLKNSTIELTVDLSSEIGKDGYRYLNGWVEKTGDRIRTSGDASIKIGYPYLPVDTSRDWKISDEELLFAIDLWAMMTQIHGWPDINNWDFWLLTIIDFWINDDKGYEYDIPAGPYPVDQEAKWKIR